MEMHKLIDYICDELKELERKAEKNGSLSMQEIQYMDTLAHAKKNLLTGEAMMEAEDGESGRYSMPHYGYGNSYNYGGSYRRGRDSMGRYTSRRGYSYDDGMIEELRSLMESAPDERTKSEFRQFIAKMEKM
jgi:hypothetical protein